MKFISFLLMLFVLSSTLLTANAYIIVTKVSKPNHIKSVHRRFKKLGLKMFYRTKKNKYIIYSGPYKNSTTTLIALKKLKTYFPHARVYNTLNRTNEQQKKKISSETKTKSENTHIYSIEKDKKSFYVAFALGYSSAPSSHIVNTGSVNISEPSKNALSYAFEGGYNYANGFSTSLGYFSFSTSDIVFNNLYLGVEYRFIDYKNYTPYFGFLAGYSSLNWSAAPITTADPTSSSRSESLFLGSKSGFSYNAYDPFILYIEYQLMFMEHATHIDASVGTTSNTSVLKNDILQTFQVGIQYKF